MARIVGVLVATALLLGPVIGLELGVRALMDAGRLPQAPSSNAEADVSLTNLLRRGRPDVLILGSSSTRSNIKPSTLERRILETTGTAVRVQNAAQAGLTLGSQRLLVEELAARDMLPDVVLTGLTPVTLGGSFGGGRDWFRLGQLGQLWSGCADLDPSSEWLDCQLSRMSAAWRWRGQPQRLVEAIGTGMPATLGEPPRLLHEDGWFEIESLSAAALARRIPSHLNRVPVDPEVSDQVLEDFAALVAALHQHGVTVVAFALPYFDDFEAALEQRFPGWSEGLSASYARLEDVSGIEIVSIEDFGGWAEPESFRDPRHLSGQGAGPFTRQLWGIDAFRQPLLEALELEPELAA